jgi:hypothetical protein
MKPFLPLPLPLPLRDGIRRFRTGAAGRRGAGLDRQDRHSGSAGAGVPVAPAVTGAVVAPLVADHPYSASHRASDSVDANGEIFDHRAPQPPGAEQDA